MIYSVVNTCIADDSESLCPGKKEALPHRTKAPPAFCSDKSVKGDKKVGSLILRQRSKCYRDTKGWQRRQSKIAGQRALSS